MADSFGQRIKAARLDLGMSQNRLAHYVNDLADTGYNISNIRKWERGVGWPHARVIPHIAAVLGVSIDYLYGLTDDPQGQSDALGPLGRD